MPGRLRLLLSVSALPFSPSGHPVFSWRASLPCGHLLGLLFRALGAQEVPEEQEAGEGGGEGAPPHPPPPQPSPGIQPEAPTRARSVRQEEKRARYLRRRQGAQEAEERGSPDSGVSEGWEEMGGVGGGGGGRLRLGGGGRGEEEGSLFKRAKDKVAKDVTEEAAETLRNISTNFLSSLKYKNVPGCEREVRSLEGAEVVTRGQDAATELAVRCLQLRQIAKGRPSEAPNCPHS